VLGEIGGDAIQGLLQPELLIGDEQDLGSSADYERSHGPQRVARFQ